MGSKVVSFMDPHDVNELGSHNNISKAKLDYRNEFKNLCILCSDDHAQNEIVTLSCLILNFNFYN